MLGAILGGVGELFSLEFPAVRFPFRLSRELGWLHVDNEGLLGNLYGRAENQFLWFGWAATLLLALVGCYLIFRFWRKNAFGPITLRRIQRFKSIRRGYISLLILVTLAGIASLDHFLVGKEALLVKCDGKWTSPALTSKVEKGKDYGLTEGDSAESPVAYRDLKKQWAEAGVEEGWILMPLVPYAPTEDPVRSSWTALTEKDGKLYKGGELYSGNASQVYDLDNPERQHLRFRFRDGIKSGVADGWDREGNRVYAAEYRGGVLLPEKQKWNGKGAVEEFLKVESSVLCEVHYRPAPPKLDQAPRHLLGTNPDGYDVVAYLYGGLQVNFKAACVYIPLVYFIGITVGLLMGYFGGWFDLIVQRVIEILSNIPFLFVVMIASTAVPEKMKEQFGLWIIIAILVAFGWMGMTYLMRTAALKEKARDYIAASRVVGASTMRVIFKHLLPNSIAIVVTLIPFSISGLVLSLTALDYLGFGLPGKYASWGRLLKDGLDALSAPWLVTSAFLCLVVVLILITFAGEAVREAFDPKKFSYYR